MIKKIICLALLATSLGLYAQSTLEDKFVAVVTIHETQPIFASQLNERIGAYREAARQMNQSLTDKDLSEILDSMVAEKIIMQDAKKRGATLTAEQVFTSIRAQNPQAGQFTDAQIRQQIEAQTGTPFDNYIATLTMQNYLQRFKSEYFMDLQNISEDEIRQFLREHQDKFRREKTVRFHHVFFNTQGLTADQKTRVFQRAERAKNELSTRSIEDIVFDYSDDASTKFDDGISYVSENDAQTRRTLGDAFVETLFSLSVNETSGIFESTLGYHIVKVTDVMGARNLSLSDQLIPGQEVTVRAFVSQQLQNQKQQEALNKIVDDLKKSVSGSAVRIFRENLNFSYQE